VQYYGQRRVRQQLGDLGRRRDRRDLAEPRAARLLARLESPGLPLGVRLRDPLGVGAELAALRVPRHDQVGTDLGQHLDRELGPLTLRQRLDDDEPRTRRSDLAAVVHRNRQSRLGGSRDGTLRERAPAVGQPDPLAGPDPADDGRVATLGAGQLQLGPVQVRQVEDRESHRPAA
jgi:hypothetical protein